MPIKLFHSPISPPSRAVRMLASVLKLKVDLIEVDILTKSYKTSELSKINPQHTVPTVVDKDFTIWDSHAIAIYLIQKYGTKSSEHLYPESLKERAVIHQRLHFDSGILYPYLYNSIFPILFQGRTNLNMSHVAGIKQAYGLLERFLNKELWLAGGKLTIADLCCIPTISTLDYLFPVKEVQMPKLIKYLARAQSLPVYEENNQEGLDQLGRAIQERVLRAKSKQ